MPDKVISRSVPGQSGSSSGAVAVKDEGTTVVATASALDFVGAGVTATDGGSGKATVTIPGGGSGLGLTRTAVKTANYTAAANQLVPVDTTSGSVTITLPTAPADGSIVVIKHVIQGGTNVVNLALGGSDVFNKAAGPTTGSLTLVNQAIFLVYTATGAVWTTISDDLPLSGLDLRYEAIASALTQENVEDIVAALIVAGTNITTSYADNGAGAGALTINATGGGGAVASDVIWDAKGDLAVGTGADTASKLVVGANGKVLVAKSGATVGAEWNYAPLTVDEVHADAGSASSVAEQILATLAIPTGIAAGDSLRFIATGDAANSSGSAVTFTWRFKIGVTTVLATAAVSMGSTGSRHKYHVEIDIFLESTALQRVGGRIGVSSANAADTWDTYNGGFSAVGYGTAAEDLTAGKNAIFSCQLGTSASTADVKLHAAALQLIRKAV